MTRTAVIFVIIHIFIKWKVSVCRLLVPINDRYKPVARFDVLGSCDVLYNFNKSEKYIIQVRKVQMQQH